MFIRGFDVSKLFRIDVGLRRRAPFSRANGLAYVELQQHRHRTTCFSGLHTRIRHERMIILRSSEEFWGANRAQMTLITAFHSFWSVAGTQRNRASTGTT